MGPQKQSDVTENVQGDLITNYTKHVIVFVQVE